MEAIARIPWKSYAPVVVVAILGLLSNLAPDGEAKIWESLASLKGQGGILAISAGMFLVTGNWRAIIFMGILYGWVHAFK